MHLFFKHLILILLFLAHGYFLRAQNEKYLENYNNYQNAVSEGKYESALEQISLSIKELEKELRNLQLLLEDKNRDLEETICNHKKIRNYLENDIKTL